MFTLSFSKYIEYYVFFYRIFFHPIINYIGTDLSINENIH